MVSYMSWSKSDQQGVCNFVVGSAKGEVFSAVLSLVDWKKVLQGLVYTVTVV